MRNKHTTSVSEHIQIARDVIRKAYETYPHDKIFVAWTGGKDSTVLLHLIKTSFDGTIPFPVMFNDSTMEFPEIYDFVKQLTIDWKLNLSVITHDPAELAEFRDTKDVTKQLELSRVMKIHAIDRFVDEHQIEAYITGIRRDEHPSRKDETFFSKRNTHMRINPILHFTEKDIWDYIRAYTVPYVTLYDQGYRSLGEKPFTSKVKKGDPERAGREQTKEKLMEKLRSMGYW
jgi:phosphoadenosine phosphosulfate reductase